jgi:hypothetical protein
MPIVGMHIHSSNPVITGIFCNQFLPRISARHLMLIAAAKNLSMTMPK